MQTRSRLGLLDALGGFLIGQHVRVPAAIAVVDRKRIAAEHALHPRVALDLLFRQCIAPGVAAKARGGLDRGPLVTVVLHGPIFAPFFGVRVILAHFDDARVRVSLLHLSLEDVGEERGNASGDRRAEDDGADDGGA